MGMGVLTLGRSMVRVGKSGPILGFTLKVEPTSFPNLLDEGLREKSQGGFLRFWLEQMKEGSLTPPTGEVGWEENQESNFRLIELKNSLIGLSRNVELGVA